MCTTFNTSLLHSVFVD